jgi:hypothetical protein
MSRPPAALRRGGSTSCRAPAMSAAHVTTEASKRRSEGTRQGIRVMANTIAEPTEKASRASCVYWAAGYGEGMAALSYVSDSSVVATSAAQDPAVRPCPPDGGLRFLRVRRVPPVHGQPQPSGSTSPPRVAVCSHSHTWKEER